MVGAKAGPATVTARVDALLAAAGTGTAAVAACARTRITSEGITILQQRGVRLLQVGMTPDAADQALIGEAAAGPPPAARRFVVASSDHDFAQVADLDGWRSWSGRARSSARAMPAAPGT